MDGKLETLKLPIGVKTVRHREKRALQKRFIARVRELRSQGQEFLTDVPVRRLT